ncbi:MAG: SpoIIE family protein phosphatase [Chloroflexi bacterium]|nr:SpoIIE family protein phosphatase [Chloroflexota bacterium]
MSRRVPANLFPIGLITMLVVLVGISMLFAYQLITDKAEDEYRAEELRVVSALSQQSEVYFNRLGTDIAVLASDPVVEAQADTRAQEWDEAPLAALEQRFDAVNTGELSVILNIIRFDAAGQARYAWPNSLNNRLKGGGQAPYSVPPDLLAAAGQPDARVDVVLYTASNTADSSTVDPNAADTDLANITAAYLLFAPVQAPSGETEFIAYQLDATQLFTQVVNQTAGDTVAGLDTGDQLWIVNTANSVVYAADPTVPIAPLLADVPLQSLTGYREVTVEDRTLDGEDRLTLIAPVHVHGEGFAVVLLRDAGAALQDVESDLQLFLGLGVAVIVLLMMMAWIVVRRLSSESRFRHQETHRRQTARTLLEVSRALNSTLDLGDVLSSIMAQLAHIVPYDSAAILMLDRAQLTVVAHRGADEKEHAETEIPLERAHAANTVLQTGRPLVVNDTRRDERWGAVESESKIRSWMGVPLRLRDKTVGVLNVNSHAVNRFKSEEVELAEAFADQASVALQNARLHEVEVKQIEQELVIASDIQLSLMPSTVPHMPQLDIASITLPARQVSGDYFQYLPMPNGNLGIAVGDVSGKGIPAAMLMAVIMTALRDEVNRNPKPSDLLNALNARLLERMKSTHLNSALMVGIFDPGTRQIEVSNGGMVQPYVRDGKTWDVVPVGGYPLGVSQRMSYSAKTITLEPGAVLLAMSDGVIEAQNPQGEFYGFDRLEKLLNDLPEDVTAQGIVEIILKSVRDHLSGEEAQDDLTILVMQSIAVKTEKVVDTPPAATEETTTDQAETAASPPAQESASSAASAVLATAPPAENGTEVLAGAIAVQAAKPVPPAPDVPAPVVPAAPDTEAVPADNAPATASPTAGAATSSAEPVQAKAETAVTESSASGPADMQAAETETPAGESQPPATSSQTDDAVSGEDQPAAAPADVDSEESSTSSASGKSASAESPSGEQA